jgi:nucleoside-diphosphate-sugar epimerase
MKVLVTGASGFVGRAVVAALAAERDEVHATVSRAPVPPLPHGVAVHATVSRAPVPPLPHGVAVALHGDLAEPVDWAPLLAGMDCLVHLAGIAHAGPGIAEERCDIVNHRATAALAAAALAAGVARVVFVSSIRAQTGPASDHVVTESDEPRRTDPYGRSKLAAERAVQRSGVPFTILRPVLVYGRGVKGNLRALMRLAALPMPLPFSALAARRSLLSLANLVAAIRFVLRHDACARETYVVADAAPVTIAEIVAALRHGMGRKPGLVAVPPALLRLALTALGRGANWEQINGALVVDPRKLIAAGWRPEPDTRGALAAMIENE